MMHLKQKLIKQFKKLSFKLNEKKYFAEMDKHFGDFFPSKSFVVQNLRSLIYEDRKYRFVYNAILLPFHTRDEEWLANFILDKARNNARLAGLRGIPFNTVKHYVQTSANFDARRNQYERDLVGAYITNWLDDTCNDYYLKADDKNFYKKNIDFDKIFREKVVRAISNLGINRSIVNLRMEENAPLWRNRVMRQTFINRIHGTVNAMDDDKRIVLCQKDRMAWDKFVNKEFGYMNLWMSDREIKYKKKHNAVVRQAGTLTPAMELNDEQVFRLRYELNQISCEYYELLNESKNIVDENNKTNGK